MGAPEVSGVHQVFDRWSEVVGETMAARTRPASGSMVDVLVIATDEPAMVTHIRFLEPELLARLEALLGPGRVTALDLRVGPQASRPRNRPRDGRDVTPRLVDFQGCDSGL